MCHIKMTKLLLVHRLSFSQASIKAIFHELSQALYINDELVCVFKDTFASISTTQRTSFQTQSTVIYLHFNVRSLYVSDNERKVDNFEMEQENDLLNGYNKARSLVSKATLFLNNSPFTICLSRLIRVSACQHLQNSKLRQNMPDTIY